MSSTDVSGATSAPTPAPATIDMKLEVVTLPVSDVDRAKSFYLGLGWRLDADFELSEKVRGCPGDARCTPVARSRSARA